jgi:ubiquinone/menaquinone biosynthesis C-methylase UbiE
MPGDPASCGLTPRPLKDRVRDFWNRHVCGSGYGTPGHSDAATVEIDFDRLTETRYQLEPYIRDLADFPSGQGKRVLEIGVGAGTDFESWLTHGARPTGIDLTPAAVDLTRRRLLQRGFAADAYTLQVGDAENLTFPDGSFDIVYSYGVLHHTPDTPRALQEVFRVLAPGGTLRAMVYHVPSVASLLLWLRYCLLRGRPFITPSQAVFEHLESPGTKAYTTAEMRRMLHEVGFVDAIVWPKLSFGDLLLQKRSKKYASRLYAAIWRLYPRWLIRCLGNRYGNALMIIAKKPSAGAPSIGERN